MTVDITRLNPPQFVEELTATEIVEDELQRLQNEDDVFADINRSDPVWKGMEAIALREATMRREINEAALKLVLAFSDEDGLTVIGNLFNTPRKVVDEGDPDANPPVPPTLEALDAWRSRLQGVFDEYSTAGPTGAYVWLSMNADDRVKDVYVQTPNPGEILVTILSHEGDGEASQDLIDVVDEALSAKFVRPVGDIVTVQSATVQSYEIKATIYLYPGPEYEPILQQAEERLQRYAENAHKLGFDIRLSALAAAAHVVDENGISLVQRVTFDSPMNDVVVDVDEAKWVLPEGITVTFGGYDE